MITHVSDSQTVHSSSSTPIVIFSVIYWNSLSRNCLKGKGDLALILAKQWPSLIQVLSQNWKAHSTESKVEPPFVMQEARREGAEMSAPQNRYTRGSVNSYGVKCCEHSTAKQYERNNAKCPFMACVGLVLPPSSWVSLQKCSQQQVFKDIDEMLLRLYLFYLYEKSPKKTRELEEIVEDVKKYMGLPKSENVPVQSQGSRWINHKCKALQCVVDWYGVYINHLCNHPYRR